MIKPANKRHSIEDVEGEPEAKIQRKNEKGPNDEIQHKGKEKPKGVKSKLDKGGKHAPKFKHKGKGNQKPENLKDRQNWAEVKKEKKQLKKARKESKTFFEVACKSKKLWEKVRRANCPLEQREELSREIHQLLKGKLSKIVFTHDLSRIVQWLLKLGSKQTKQSIIEELISHVPALLMSQYACHCVKSMFKYGTTASKRAIVHSLHGKVVKLANHSIAAPRLEIIYSKWATGKERNLLRQEFYGDMYKKDKESDFIDLADIFKKTPDMKNAILSAVKTNLSKSIEKKQMKSSLIHTVLSDFLKHCNDTDREEICTQLQDSLLDLSSTRDGALAATICICQSSNKVKKHIMKGLKGHVKEIAKSEHGHLLLLALFDTVDDTVLLNKTLMPELLGDLRGLAENDHGRKVILYLVAHREPMYFHPADIAKQKEGVSFSRSKKEMDLRIAEIRKAILNPLLETIEMDAATWMSNNSIEMLTLAVLKAGKGPEAVKAFKAVADYVCDPSGKIKEDGNEYYLAEHAGTHMMLKKLILHDKERVKEGEEINFSSVLASKLSEETLKTWIRYNRGCFILVLLLESTVESVVEDVQKRLQGHTKIMKEQNSTGAKILQKKLNI